MVSGMEAHEMPSPEETAAALQDIETTRSNFATASVPPWYIPVAAAMIVPIPLISLLPSTMTGGLIDAGKARQRV